MGAPLPPFAFLPAELSELVTFRQLFDWPENLSDGAHYWVEKFGVWLAVEEGDAAMLKSHGGGIPVWTVEKLRQEVKAKNPSNPAT